MKKSLSFSLLAVTFFAASALLSSCFSSKPNVIVPRSVSTAAITSIEDLRLQKGDYEILRTITESASIICEYNGSNIEIISGDGDFKYNFHLDKKDGWQLNSFSGVAALGYFASDLNLTPSSAPEPEEFARRVAISRIIAAAADYNADGIIEPITVTSVASVGRNKVEYRSTVKAKLVSIKPTK